MCDIAIYFRTPLESDGRQIAMAHDDLAKVVNAMIWLSGSVSYSIDCYEVYREGK